MMVNVMSMTGFVLVCDDAKRSVVPLSPLLSIWIFVLRRQSGSPELVESKKSVESIMGSHVFVPEVLLRDHLLAS